MAIERIYNRPDRPRVETLELFNSSLHFGVSTSKTPMSERRSLGTSK